MKKNGFMDGAIIATMAIILSKILGVLYVIPFYSIIGNGGELYGYAYQIYNMFLIISSAGIPLAISKLTSEYITKNENSKKDAMFKIARNIIVIFSVLAFIVCFFASDTIAKILLAGVEGTFSISDVSFTIKCVSFALLIVPFLSIYRGFLQGHKYITSPSISQVIEQIVRIAVILIGSYLAMKVFNLGVVIAVGISVAAAAVGAIASYIYLKIKSKSIKRDKNATISKEDKKEIIKKVITYSIPFIIINLSNSIYNTVDMILVRKGLDMIGYSGEDIGTIQAVFTTWGHKLLNVVTAFATGLVVSLIPSLVASYVSGKKEEVNNYFNKALQIICFVVLPLTIFMSIFSKEIWTVFYGEAYFGPIIFSFNILTAFLDCGYIMSTSALQSMYKTKLVYISSLIGIFFKAALDIPFILLFDKIGIYPFYGAILATIIGYIISLTIVLISLHKNEGLRYNDTLNKLPKLLLSIASLIIICLIVKNIVPYSSSRLINIIYLSSIGIICLIVYLLFNKNELKSLFKEKLNKLIKKGEKQ